MSHHMRHIRNEKKRRLSLYLILEKNKNPFLITRKQFKKYDFFNKIF